MHICEKCNKPATVHLTEVNKNGKNIEIHLCDSCAQEAGYVQQSHTPINELLNQFLKSNASINAPQAPHCPDCGMTWQEFKDTSLLGCPKDYTQFEPQLKNVIEQAQHGFSRHTGKVPHSKSAPSTHGTSLAASAETVTPADPVKLRLAELARLKKQLAQAVEDESYEMAAKLRDQIKALEQTAGQ